MVLEPVTRVSISGPLKSPIAAMGWSGLATLSRLRQPWHLDPHERTPPLVLGPVSTRLQSLSWQQIPRDPERLKLLPSCGPSLIESAGRAPTPPLFQRPVGATTSCHRPLTRPVSSNLPFFFEEEEGISERQKQSHVRYRSSPRTSCQVGSFPEPLGVDRRPRSDAANAFAAAHDRSAAFLLHAASTLPFNSSGAPCAFVLRQRSQETGCFGRPSTSDLASKDDEPGPCPGSPITMQCADQSRQSRVGRLQTGTTLLRRLLIVCHRRLAPVANPSHGPSRWSRPLLRPLDRCVPQQPTSPDQST